MSRPLPESLVVERDRLVRLISRKLPAGRFPAASGPLRLRLPPAGATALIAAPASEPSRSAELGLGQRPEVLPVAEGVCHREPAVGRERGRTRREPIQLELVPLPPVEEAPETDAFVVVAGEQPRPSATGPNISRGWAFPAKAGAARCRRPGLHEHGPVVKDRHEVARGGDTPAPIDGCVDAA